MSAPQALTTAHREEGELEHAMVLSHNVAVRRSAWTSHPFGPFRGRVGGDRYLTESIKRRGGRVLLVPDLLIHHEDISNTQRS